MIDETLAAAGLTHGALAGAGVSLPGPIRHHPDVAKPSAILPGWYGVTGQDIGQALGVPVSIDNDANPAVRGEHVRGAGQGCDDCIAIKFHYGIGCGLFLTTPRHERRGFQPSRAGVPVSQPTAPGRTRNV